MVERRELDLLARQVAILSLKSLRISQELENLHRALLQVGVPATGDRNEVGVGRRPLFAVPSKPEE